MNQKNQITTGNLTFGHILSASMVGYQYSIDTLSQILRSFNLQEMLGTLARINLLLQVSEGFSEEEKFLKKTFCSDDLLNKIIHKGLVEGFMFTRQSCLRLLTESACSSDINSKRYLDKIDAMNELATSYLIVNELITAEAARIRQDIEVNIRKDLLVGSIPTLEYAIHPNFMHRTVDLMVRSKEYSRILSKIPSNIDVKDVFYKATGLTIKEYQYLIFNIAAKYLLTTRQEILKNEGMVFNFESSPHITSLYDKLCPHVSISIDVLRRTAQKPTKLENEFRLWRQYPLVSLTKYKVICIDLGFLVDKLETGMFWIIRDELKKTGESKMIFDLWGNVLERYTASIIKRVINNQKSPKSSYIVSPKFQQKAEEECTDIAVCDKDSLILIECKASVLSAQVKLGGDFRDLREGLVKIIEESGIRQLWEAIQKLVHTNIDERKTVEGIDISKVKRIYPVLLLSDNTFASLYMNWFFKSEFERLKKDKLLMKHLNIVPLTVLTIAELEQLEPYIKETPFQIHIDRWFAQFGNQDHLGFGAYLQFLEKNEYCPHEFMEEQFEQIKTDLQVYFTSPDDK